MTTEKLRLDVLLVRAHPGLSRRKAREVIEKGQVSLNGKTVREAGLMVAAGARPRWDPNRPALRRARLSLPRLYEDEHVLVVDKPAEQAPVKGAAGNTRCRILIVDDNMAAAEILAMAIQLLGNEVRVAHDGVEGVKAAEEYQPDIVLMDIGMPNMNGYEATRHIRQQPWGKEMMIVALTGWGQEKDKEITQKSGFNHHLVKPADPAELQRLLAQSARRLT